MFKSPITIPDEFVEDISYNHLHGRMLRLPANKKVKNPKTIVYVYGQHSSLERWYSIAEFFSDYGNVIMFDLPGLGGMTSFYDIGLKPTYDNYADYIYTLLKTNKLNKDLYIVASSFGSQVMTRMYQKHPDSQKWIKSMNAIVGFAAGSNFKIKGLYGIFAKTVARVASTRLGHWFFRNIIFNRYMLRVIMFFFARFKSKMQDDDNATSKKMVEMESYLWWINHYRTHGSTALIMFYDDLRRYSDGSKIKLTMHNVITDHDQYFDNEKVERDFRTLYEGYETSILDLKVHAPSLIASKKDVKDIMPEELIQKLKED